MKADKKNMATRRQWFAAGLRWGIVGLISAVSGHFLSRKKTDDQSCVDPKGHTGCRGCGVLNGCSLPRALSVKQFLNQKNEKRES
jgi:hypothetical protein